MANVNNYIAAGRASVKKALIARKALADNKADYGALGVESIKAARDMKIAAIQANAKVASAAQNAMTKVEGANIIVERDKSIAASKRSARKAGMLAGGAAMLGVGAMQMNKKDEPNEQLGLLQQQINGFDERLTALKTKEGELKAALKSLDQKPTVSPSSTTETNPTSGGQQISAGGSLNLTNSDFKEIAYAVSSEAALGTDDEFGVAANIITRLRSGNYGSSVSEIIRAPGQYQGVYSGNSRYSPEIQARLQSPEGQAKISDFIKKLDGRTEFKGQTMLQNRVPDEDPMFDPSGNFYHYAGQ